jgi:hypothetical protein
LRLGGRGRRAGVPLARPHTSAPSAPRAPTAAFLLLLGALLLGGCGGSGGHSSETMSTVTVAARNAPGSAPTTASGKLTRAQGRALARAVNLTAADVSGFALSHESEHETRSESRGAAELTRCAGAGRFPVHQPVEAHSPTFERGTSLQRESVRSSVQVARSSRLALEELAAVKSTRARRCFARFLRRALLGSSRPAGSTISAVHVSEATPPAAGVTGSFALRLFCRLSVEHVALPVFIDFLGFDDGPVEVTLQTSGLSAPVPASLEEHLFSLLLERTRSHYRG